MIIAVYFLNTLAEAHPDLMSSIACWW